MNNPSSLVSGQPNQLEIDTSTLLATENTEAKRKFATHSDLSVAIEDLEKTKGREIFES